MKATEILKDAIQLQRDRAEVATQALARQVVAGRIGDAAALLVRAGEAGVTLDALEPAVELRVAAADAVRRAKRRVEGELARLVSDEQREMCRASIVRDALFPLLELVPARAEEIQAAASAANRIANTIDRARTERVYLEAPGSSRPSWVETLRQRVREAPAPEFPGSVDGELQANRRARAERELADYEALLADVQRVAEFEAEHRLAVARVDQLRAEAWAELEREFGL